MTLFEIEAVKGWTIHEGMAPTQVPSPTSGFTLRESAAWFVEHKSERKAGPFFSEIEAENFILHHHWK